MGHSPNCRIPLLLTHVKGDNPYREFQTKCEKSRSRERCIFWKNISPSELTARFFKDYYLSSREEPIGHVRNGFQELGRNNHIL